MTVMGAGDFAQVSWDSMPKVLSARTANTVPGGMAGPIGGIGRSLSEAVDRTSHSRDGLAYALSRQVAEGRNATRRHRTALGRFYNRLTGAQAFYVKMPAHHARQLEVFTGCVFGETPMSPGGLVLIRWDVASRALGRLLPDSNAQELAT